MIRLRCRAVDAKDEDALLRHLACDVAVRTACPGVSLRKTQLRHLLARSLALSFCASLRQRTLRATNRAEVAAKRAMAAVGLSLPVRRCSNVAVALRHSARPALANCRRLGSGGRRQVVVRISSSQAPPLKSTPAPAERRSEKRQPSGGGGGDVPKQLWRGLVKRLSNLPLALAEMGALAVLSAVGTVIEQNKARNNLHLRMLRKMPKRARDRPGAEHVSYRRPSADASTRADPATELQVLH